MLGGRGYSFTRSLNKYISSTGYQRLGVQQFFFKKHQSPCSHEADIPVRDTINPQINKMYVGLAMSAKEKK